MDILLGILVAIAYLIYGVFLLIMWLLPFILLLLGALFVRKLVLDAVREARRVERD